MGLTWTNMCVLKCDGDRYGAYMDQHVCFKMQWRQIWGIHGLTCVIKCETDMRGIHGQDPVLWAFLVLQKIMKT